MPEGLTDMLADRAGRGHGVLHRRRRLPGLILLAVLTARVEDHRRPSGTEVRREALPRLYPPPCSSRTLPGREDEPLPVSPGYPGQHEVVPGYPGAIQATYPGGYPGQLPRGSGLYAPGLPRGCPGYPGSTYPGVHAPLSRLARGGGGGSTGRGGAGGGEGRGWAASRGRRFATGRRLLLWNV